MTELNPRLALYPREKDAIRCLLDGPLVRVKKGRYTSSRSLSAFSGETVGSLIAMGVAERYGTTEIRLTEEGRRWAVVARRLWNTRKGGKS
jgi:hypothetical protein